MLCCVSCLISLFVVGCLGNNDTSSTASPHTATALPTQHVVVMNFWNNFQVMQRAFYVLIGVSVLAVLYFVIRTVRLKKKPLRKKYGLLSDYDENMEMGSLDSDEEKIYEAKSLRR
ncbi:protein FAM174C [Spea bombifrons]|uniref:protein FAM174C n=1 Tax=Spea bombifrons TaxID=233779 RepID=UPI00234B2439|nr:protein FAM174C [Spea bombifrons]